MSIEKLFRENIRPAVHAGILAGLLLGLINVVASGQLANLSYLVTEIMLAKLRPLMPPLFSRFIGTPAGIITFYVAIGVIGGAFTGAVVFLIQAVLKVRSEVVSKASFYFAAMLGGFAFVCISGWARLSVIHNNSDVISLIGIGWVGLAAVVGLLVGRVTWLTARGVRKVLTAQSQGTGRVFSSVATLLGTLGIILTTFVLTRSGFPFTTDGHGSATGGMETKRHPVVLIAIDAADWDVLGPLIENGKLPNIEKLVRSGVSGQLRSLIPMKSPSVWTSVVTGKTEEQHGITDFVSPEPVGASDKLVPVLGYKINPVTSAQRKTKALWNVASDYGRKVCVVGWYVTWPAEDVNGVMVSDRVTYLPLKERVFPASLTHEVDEIVQANERKAKEDWKLFTSYKIDETPVGVKIYDPDYMNRKRIEFIKLSLLLDRTTADITSRLAPRDDYDFIAFYLRGVDFMQHYFWKYRLERENAQLANSFFNIDESEERAFKDLIDKYYEYADSLVGEVLNSIDGDPDVIITSDHGFGLFTETARFYKLDPLFNILGWLEFQQGNEVDWPRTRVYDAFNNTRGPDSRRVRINLKGREPNGTVELSDYKNLREEVEKALLGLKTRDGRKLVTSVKLYAGDPMKNREDGDLLVSVNGALMAGKDEMFVVGGQTYPTSSFIFPKGINGTHAMNGVLIMSGPDFRKDKRTLFTSVLDVAPTVLYLLGIPVGTDMHGNVLANYTAPEFAAYNSPQYVPSHEGEKPLRRRSVESDEKVEEQVKDVLRSLNYLK